MSIQTKHKNKNLLFLLTLFSIAMGYLESSVVVYLRKIYYPEGFGFPLIPVEPSIAITEFWREAATIIMLAGIGFISGTNRLQRFAWFVYCFGIWDIFYYVFLKVLIGWPESLFTWDILFLIPVPWVGPVLAPCIVSLTLIAFALLILSKNIRVTFLEWLLMITGCSVIIFSFLSDYIGHVTTLHSLTEIWSLGSSKNLFDEIKTFVPSAYNWWVFAAGELMMITVLVLFINRILKKL